MDSELIEKAIQIAKNNRDNFCISLLQKELKVGSFNWINKNKRFPKINSKDQEEMSIY